MTDAPPNLPGDRSHLQRLVNAWAERNADRVTAGRANHLVGVLVIVSAFDGLKDHEGVERIAYKGGAALELRLGFGARASKDLDAAFRGSLDNAFELMREALEVGWMNFDGTMTEPEEINVPGQAVKPRRTQVKLRYKGRPFTTVPIELSVAEGRSLDKPDRAEAVIDISPIQLPGPDAISFLPIPYQVAQKLHACTDELDGGEKTNQRARDLLDLILIEDLLLKEDRLPATRSSLTELVTSLSR